MKFEVENNVIEISVRGKHDKRCSKEKTMHFMNFLSILFDDAAELAEREFAEHPDQTFYVGKNGVIQQMKDASTQIYKQLDALGAYNH